MTKARIMAALLAAAMTASAGAAGLFPGTPEESEAEAVRTEETIEAPEAPEAAAEPEEVPAEEEAEEPGEPDEDAAEDAALEDAEDSGEEQTAPPPEPIGWLALNLEETGEEESQGEDQEMLAEAVLMETSEDGERSDAETPPEESDVEASPAEPEAEADPAPEKSEEPEPPEEPWYGPIGYQEDLDETEGSGRMWDLGDREVSAQEQKKLDKLEQLVEQVTVNPEKLDFVSFTDVAPLVRANNLTVQGLEETITGIQSTDYEKLENNLRDSINGIATAQDAMYLAGSLSGQSMAAGVAANSMQSAYDSAYQTFLSIRNGDMQRSNADTVLQLRNAQDSLVKAGEATYIALIAMDAQETSLERQLAAMNRTVEEMELRYDLGQISNLTLQQTKSGRTALASGLETLRMNISNYKMQLEALLGTAPTGEIRLGALPEVTEEQLRSMDLEADLASAREKSYSLYAAARTLEAAQETFNDTGKSTHYNEKNNTYRMAIHTWAADQNTYNNTVRSFELSFRTHYAQVLDYYQIYQASLSALETQQAACKAQELRYHQGNLSKNALLSARDELKAAEEKAASDANNLFSAYNDYLWAVQKGIMN